VKKETEGRKGKTDGQPAHTREVKLGCVFTQTTWDKEGYPIHRPAGLRGGCRDGPQLAGPVLSSSHAGKGPSSASPRRDGGL